VLEDMETDGKDLSGKVSQNEESKNRDGLEYLEMILEIADRVLIVGILNVFLHQQVGLFKEIVMDISHA
jgi:hypothetical protein